MDSMEMRLAQRFAEIARLLLTAQNVKATLGKITEVAVELIDGCESAGIDIIDGGTIFAVAATSPVAARIDAIQVEVGEGPCLQSLRDHEVFSTGDLATETRWPKFSRRAYEETGILSIMGFRLFADADTMGALDLYSSQPDAFGPDTETLGLVLASQASVALSTARSREGLEEALATRDIIGQAKGILMERHGIGAEAAFDLLREASQRRNIKLRQVAETLVATAGERADQNG
jgi:GAF domain-containing protein